MKIRQPLEELRLDRDPNAPPFVRSKKGMYFQTVCDPCHAKSTVDDQRLKDFVIGANQALSSSAAGTGAVGVRAPSDAVIRSILFHNMTSRFESDGNKFEEKIRKTVLGNSSAGSNLYLYIWQYGGTDIFMMHDFMALPWLDHLSAVLSFPPLTFVIRDSPMVGLRGHNVEEHLLNPKPYVVIDRHSDLSPFWPRDSGAVLGGARFAEHIVGEPGS